MARDFRRTAKKLKKEGAYDHDLTHTMLVKFADDGQDRTQSPVMQTYHFVVLQLRLKVDKALAQARFMHNRRDQDDLMSRQKLTVVDVCDAVADAT